MRNLWLVFETLLNRYFSKLGHYKKEMGKMLNSNRIKLIAILAMTIDHITWAVYSGYPKDVLPLVLHVIGRITCPIMCYFIAEGYHHTKDINKYTWRLFLFSIISHFAYVFASMDFIDWKSFIPFYYGNVFNQTSVLWSLAWGLVMLRVVYSQNISNGFVKIFLVFCICLISFPSDWSCVASLCVMAFGVNRGKMKTQMLWMAFYVAIYATVYFFAIDKVYGLLQMSVILAIPILMLYNGQRGSSKKMNNIMKWVFYLYYPFHLFVIGLLQYVN